jgi:RNA polymerase sigma factor (sigma-70 family)
MSFGFVTEDLDELVKKCINRDGRAWARLVDRFQSLVYSIPRRYGLNDEDVADVFQTTFQALLRNLDRIEAAATLPKWLAVTAARESLRIKRISSRSISADSIGMDLESVLTSEESSAEEASVLAERADIVRRQTQSLPERCRDLLTMLYLSDDPPYQEIAEKLGMPIGAIGPTRARCLEKLRRKLEESKFFGEMMYQEARREAPVE